MKIKKLFAMTAVLCICLNMAACGKTAEDNPAETTAATTTTTVETTTTTEATTTAAPEPATEVTTTTEATTTTEVTTTTKATTTTEATTTQNEEPAEKVVYEPCQEILDADFNSGLMQIGNDIFHIGGYYTVDQFIEEFSDRYDMSDIDPEEKPSCSFFISHSLEDPNIRILIWYTTNDDSDITRKGDEIVYNISSNISSDETIWFPHGLDAYNEEYDISGFQTEIENRGFSQIDAPFNVIAVEYSTQWEERLGYDVFWLDHPTTGNHHMTDLLGFRVRGTEPNLFGKYPSYEYRLSKYTDSPDSKSKPTYVSCDVRIDADNTVTENFLGGNSDKPVIYLYPEKETQVDVKLELHNAEFWTTYPKYEDGWSVTAKPDGKLTDKDGHTYDYLFWDAKDRNVYDMSKGFCVKGEDTVDFLREKLTELGLNESEMNEFITYWLPRMEHNKYNLVAFQTTDYERNFPLTVTPEPDSVLRVFMTYKPLDEYTETEPQQLHGFERKGFTVVEWGGEELGNNYIQ